MLERSSALLVDIGNSRIKYALVTDIQHMTVAISDDLHTLEGVIAKANRVIVGSVNRPETIDLLKQMCRHHAISLQEITTTAEALGISCAYENHQTLGVDRWLAILGAKLHTHKVVGIIDIGTAATFDVVEGNQHLGGWIAPGLTLQKHTVTSSTQKVFGDDSRPTTYDLGLSTPACVNAGCVAMMSGFVSSAITYMQAHYKDFDILLCGGDADLVNQGQFPQIKMAENLVIEGLSRFI